MVDTKKKLVLTSVHTQNPIHNVLISLKIPRKIAFQRSDVCTRFRKGKGGRGLVSFFKWSKREEVKQGFAFET